MPRRLAVTVVVVVAALAAVQSATPLSSYTDPAGDAGTAQDVVSVTVDDDSAGHITFTIGFAAQQDFRSDSRLYMGIDADNKPATGDPAGADYLFAYFGDSRASVLGRWDGSEFTNAGFRGSVAVATAPGSIQIILNKFDMGITTAFSFEVESLQLANGPFPAADFAPDLHGTYSYTLAAPPPPLPPPPPSPPTVSLGKVAAKGVVHAGKAFSVSAPVDTDASAVKVACSSKVGTRAVRMSGRYSAATGTATCTGIAPRGTAGKRVTGTMTVSAGGARATKAFVVPIKK